MVLTKDMQILCITTSHLKSSHTGALQSLLRYPQEKKEHSPSLTTDLLGTPQWITRSFAAAESWAPGVTTVNYYEVIILIKYILGNSVWLL